MKAKGLAFLMLISVTISNAQQVNKADNSSDQGSEEKISDNKLVIYQIFTRLFGNKNTTNKFYGSIEENGVGKFNDITDQALKGLKELSVSHVWYTGVIEHATMTDYSAYGIKQDDPDIVKGKAGSPYAIKDYYDVDPDLAVDVKNRMGEFEDLVKRTHSNGLKILIDFVPNHVARTYNSDIKPAAVRDFGQDDDKGKAFSPQNDFYYIPGKAFIVPEGTNAGGDGFVHPMKDGKFDEDPAKATGNNVFSERPSLNDWSETIKLNYGVDFQNGERRHFSPTPPVWNKMRDILVFWTNKGVDGFRCDMAEMVPVEFWSWVIPQVKKVNPKLIFIAEAYNPKVYEQYLTEAKFDFLYDKVGLYDGLKKLIKNDADADVKSITHVWKEESRGFSSRMLRFLENHDEERIASKEFAQNPWYAEPAMVISATLGSGPVMIYFGQEVGEPGAGNEGFGGEDNRTTIFDYWGVPEHQRWMNNGKFDGGQLLDKQQKLRKFYKKLLEITTNSDAIRKGDFYELAGQQGLNSRMYAYVRYTPKERVLVVSNFDRAQTLEAKIQLPDELKKKMRLGKKPVKAVDLMTGNGIQVKDVNEGIPVKVLPTEALILQF